MNGISKRLNWKRVLACVAIGGILMCLVLHSWILQAIYSALVYDDTTRDEQYVVVVAEINWFEEALAAAKDDNVKMVVLFNERPSNTERIGARRAFGDLARETLLDAGAPNNKFEVLDGDASTHEDIARGTCPVNHFTGCLQNRWLQRLLMVLFVFTVLWFCRRPILRGIAGWLDVGDLPRRTDCVYALLGEENTRPFVAASLQQAGLADRVLLSRFRPQEQANDNVLPPPEEVYRDIYLLRGVPADAIAELEQPGYTTFSEIESLRHYMADRPAETVTVVTSQVHMRRTRWSCQQVLGDEIDRVAFVSSPTEKFNKERFVVGTYISNRLLSGRGPLIG